ncbi:MAG: tetratricopeptide repeat protein [Bacteroidales bacterium]
MNRIILCLLLLTGGLCTNGQEDRLLGIAGNALSWMNPATNPDSLIALLPQLTGTEKVDMLCEISNAFQRSVRKIMNVNDGQQGKTYYTITEETQTFYEDHIRYAEEALKLAEDLNYNNGKVTACFLLGSYTGFTQTDDINSLLRYLQKAEHYFDGQTHWTMKYRVWRRIGDIYGYLNVRDSAFYYFRKPLLLLDEDTAWLASFHSHLWLMREAVINNDHKAKNNISEKIIYLINRNNLFYSFVKHGHLIPDLEEFCIHMSNAGEYRLASSMMIRALDSLESYEMKTWEQEYWTAKIMGRIARIYSHWGKYDSALIWFDSSLRYFYKIYEDYSTVRNWKIPTDSMRHEGWTRTLVKSERGLAINMANQLEEKAVVLIKTGNLKQAEEDLIRSIEIRNEYYDYLGVAMCYDKMGELYAIRGRFNEALLWYDTAVMRKYDIMEMRLQMYRGISALYYLFVRESISNTLLKKGRLYEEWGKQKLSMEYLNRSLAFSREIGSQKCEAEALTAIGDIYLSLKHPDSALTHYRMAQAIYETMANRPGMAAISMSMGNFYKTQGQNAEALEYYKQSRDIYEALEMPANVAEILMKEGEIFMNERKAHAAMEKYKSGLEIAAALNLSKLEMECHQKLSDIYESFGEIEKAFRHHKKYTEIKDELFTLEINRHIEELETQYESEKNRQEIVLLQSEKQVSESRVARGRMIMFSLGGFIVLLMLWISLYLRHSRLKNGHEMLQLQQKLFRSQMNPHFIYNSLGSIQQLIMYEQPEKAVRFLSRFSKLMRSVLDSSIEDFVLLSEEITTIENYLELQHIRFPEKFDYFIEVDESIDPENIHIPSMLTQPFIENAIEHGLMPKKTEGHILIVFKRTNGTLILEIEDNGIGRQKARELLLKRDKNHKSVATNITRERIDVLNRKLKKNITLDIIDLKDDKGKAKGTKVIFEIPVG